jgi:hypothetical protein
MQLVQLLAEMLRAAQQFEAHELHQLDATLALMREQIAAWLLPGAQAGSRQSAPSWLPDHPIAVTSRQAARLIGIGHPLFYKEVMPHVYSGEILSCQFGPSRVILVDSLRAWVEQFARGGAAPLEHR